MAKKKYCYEYPHPAVTTDCVVFGFDGTGLNALLIKRGVDPYKDKWALPGGFLRMDETAREGASRELMEETGVKDIFLEQLHTFTDVERDPRERVITIAYYALIRQADYNEVAGGDDASDARWFSVNDFPPLAFDHDRILRIAKETLQQRIHFEPIGFHLLNDKFTMPQLQTIYESILNVRFDRRNFSKKMLALGYLVSLNQKVEGTPYRAPSLYSFNEERYNELKKVGIRLEF